MSWPLLEMCQGERDEIAFVLGHEMAHIVRRHAVDRIIKDAALSLLLRHSSGRHAVSAWLDQTGRQMLTCAYSRDNELEADAFAAAILQGGPVPVPPEDAVANLRVIERLFAAGSGA